MIGLQDLNYSGKAINVASAVIEGIQENAISFLDMRKRKRWVEKANFVAAMIGRLGGIGKAREILGISENTLRKYLAAGSMAEAPYWKIVKASHLTGFSVEELTGIKPNGKAAKKPENTK